MELNLMAFRQPSRRLWRDDPLFRSGRLGHLSTIPFPSHPARPSVVVTGSRRASTCSPTGSPPQPHDHPKWPFLAFLY
ncbi:hypothetical protein FRACA_3540002 [Frankia canadensis]|uniref:Uncharacterized protein n=1 Tax=Frankia canadensis TaxID=1836972 RepID=A0A2I2KVC5_9ACTN|nr:hypothetical protein FRACA_3540002 [Frankia canadensis]SOU56913.1 hypothetical protein FRACA_3540002 [Frankia canadensis]